MQALCAWAHHSSHSLSHLVSRRHLPPVPMDLFWRYLIGAAVAGVFGILIGIPVLRLRGDYLAIVTLAFGEIIKNLINILYVGADKNGIHAATTSSGLELAAGGKKIMKGALGISGTATLYKEIKPYFFPDRSTPCSAYSVYCTEPGSFQKRPCSYVYKRQPYCGRVSGNQCDKI